MLFFLFNIASVKTSEIAVKLYNSKTHRDYCRTLCNKDEHSAEDLFSDSVAALLEKGPEKIEKIWANGKMETYFACIIRYRHLTKMKKSRLFDKYAERLSGSTSEEETTDSKMEYVTVAKILDKMHFYPRGLLLLYLQYESYKEISVQTQIPYYSVYFGIREARKELRKIVYG